MRDEDLLRDLKEHKEDALAYVKKTYEPLFLYMLSQKGLSKEDIEECLNDIYIQIWTQIYRYDKEKAELKTFFSVIARNVAFHKLRKNYNYTKHLQATDLDQIASPTQQLDEEKEVLKQLIQTLSHEEKELFYRKYFYMQSVEQIASETCHTKKSIEAKLYRLRKKLRGRWKESEKHE